MLAVTDNFSARVVPVTRDEIIDITAEAFSRPPATKQNLVTVAIHNHGRPQVLNTLQRLPDRSFGHVHDLWDHLPDVATSD